MISALNGPALTELRPYRITPKQNTTQSHNAPEIATGRNLNFSGHYAAYPPVLLSQVRFGTTASTSQLHPISFDSKGNLIEHYTMCFRDPHFYDHVPALLNIRFPEGTTIESMAASYGEEPLCLALRLIDIMGAKNARKYKIRASDKHPEVLARGKAGIIAAHGETEEEALEQLYRRSKQSGFQHDIRKWVTPIPAGQNDHFRLVHSDRLTQEAFKARGIKVGSNDLDRFRSGFDLDHEYLFQIKPVLMNSVRQMVAFQDTSEDCLDALETHEDDQKPRFVVLRNVFYMIQPQDRLFKDLDQHMPVGSILSIGTSEYYHYENPQVYNGAKLQETLEALGYVPQSQFTYSVSKGQFAPDGLTHEYPMLYIRERLPAASS